MGETNDECQDGSPKKTRGGTLNRRQYKLFVEFLGKKVLPAHDELKRADLVDEALKGVKGQGMYARFRAWAKRLTLRESDKVLLFTKSGKKIICSDDFESVVRLLNTSPIGTHRSFSVTLKLIREKYTMGKRQFGMSEDTVREILFTCTSPTCPCKKVKKVPPVPRVDVPSDGSTQASDSQGSVIILSDRESESIGAGKTEAASSGCESKPAVQPLPSSTKPRELKKIRPRTISSTENEKKKNSSVSYFAVLNLQDIAKLTGKAMTSVDTQDTFTPVVKNVVTFRPYVQQENDIASSATVSFANTSAVTIASPSTTLQSVSKKIITGSSCNPFSVDFQSSTLGSLQGRIITPSSTSACITTVSPSSSTAYLGRMSDKAKTSEKKRPYPTSMVPNYCSLEWEKFRKSHPMFATASPPQKSILQMLPRSSSSDLDVDKFAVVGDVLPSTSSDKFTLWSNKTPPSSTSISTSFFDQKYILPHKNIWYHYEDIDQQPHKYKKLMGAIHDMKTDVRQMSVGIKPASEKLKQKIAVTEDLLSQCRDVAWTRRKQLHSCNQKKLLSKVDFIPSS